MPTIIEDPFYLVQRGSFEADGIARLRGEVVDTTGWKNVPPLVSQRYLAPVPKSIADLHTCGCGRRWLDEEASAQHGCPVDDRTQTKRPRRGSAAA